MHSIAEAKSQAAALCRGLDEAEVRALGEALAALPAAQLEALVAFLAMRSPPGALRPQPVGAVIVGIGCLLGGVGGGMGPWIPGHVLSSGLYLFVACGWCLPHQGLTAGWWLVGLEAVRCAGTL